MFNEIMEEFVRLCEKFDGMTNAEGVLGAWKFDLFTNSVGDRIFRLTCEEAKEPTEEEARTSFQ